MVSEKNIQKVEERVAKLQNDTSLDWARKPLSLKALAFSTSFLAAATPIAFLGGSILGISSAALMFAGYALLRGATRGIAELPERFLDERELKVRNATYVKAFQNLAGLVGALAVVLFIVAISLDVNDKAVQLELTFDQLQAFVWLLLGPITVLPTVTLALKLGGKK